ITIEIAGDTQPLNKALKDVNKSSQDIQKELRQVERLLKFNPGNTELLAQKQKLLGEQVATTREKLDRLKMAQAQVDEQFRKGEIGEGQYRAVQRELVETESKLKHFEKQLAATKKGLADYGKALQDAGKKMTDAGKNLSMKVTAPIVGLGAVIAKTGMDFEAGMSEVGAISGATGKDLQALESLAKEMGATTKFSASDAADGLKFMAMAGWDTQQMMDGLPGVLNLAAASGEDLGKVSDIVTDAMTAFGMEAVRAGEFADTLAAAASNSNTNVGLLGESFKYVAPVAGALGYEAKDTATALGLMANAGIKGSQSGSALRTILTNLAKPTKQMQDAMSQYGISLTHTDGSMKSLDEVMLNLRDSLGGLTEAEQAAAAATIFGKEAMSGALAIVNTGEEDYNKLSGAINNSTGAAERMAKEMQDNLKGRLTELKSAIEGAALQLYEALLPAFEKIVAVLQKAVDWFSKLNPGVKSTIVVIAGLVAAIGPLLLVFGPLLSVIGTVITSVAAMSTALAGGATVLAGLTAGFPVLGAAVTLAMGPIGIAVGAIASIVVAGNALCRHFKQDAIPAVRQFGDEVSETTQQAVGGFLDLEDTATKSLNQLNWGCQEVTNEMATALTETFGSMKDQITQKLNEQKTDSVNILNEMFRDAVNITEKEKEEILNITTSKYDAQIRKTEEGNQKIEEILVAASKEKRQLTKSEQEEIKKIKEEMKNDAIRILSESEEEQLAILRHLELESGVISARQAAEIVKTSLEQKEETIKNAKVEYLERIKIANRLRQEGTEEAKKAADEIEKEAKRQKEETIKHAKEMHQKVITEAKEQAKEHVNQVDWETGEIKTKWQALAADIATKANEIKKDVSQKWEEIKTDTAAKWTDIKTEVSTTAENIRLAAINKWEELKLGTIQKWDELRTATIQWGRNIVQGLADGIRDKITIAINAIGDVVDGIKNKVKTALGIASPSTVMKEYGQDISQGLADGIEDKYALIETAMGTVVTGVKGKVTEALDFIEGLRKEAARPIIMGGVMYRPGSANVGSGMAGGTGGLDDIGTPGNVSTWLASDGNWYTSITDSGGSTVTIKGKGEGVQYAGDFPIEYVEPGKVNVPGIGVVDVADDVTSPWDWYQGGGSSSSGGGSSGGSSYDSGGNYTGSEGTGTGQYTGGYEVVDHGDYYDVPGIGKVPKKAKGGILTAPQFVFAGEAGHEALLPLEELQPMMAQALVQATSSMQTALSIDYDRLAEVIVKYIKPSVIQHNTFNSPEPLTPSETARQNLKVSRKLAMEWGL
ncbi:MAG: phage tail tape measure protein, partial [Christensenellales bacterium]